MKVYKEEDLVECRSNADGNRSRNDEVEVKRYKIQKRKRKGSCVDHRYDSSERQDRHAKRERPWERIKLWARAILIPTANPFPR